jgi:hypothetical protein
MGEFSLLVRMELPLAVRPPEPQPARKPPPSTAGPDNTGFAVFTAGGGQVLALNLSYSASFSRSMQQEQERVVDRVRVKQMTTNPQTGEQEVNEDNYIDTEVTKKLAMREASGQQTVYSFTEQDWEKLPNIEVIDGNIVQKNPNYTPPSGGTSSSGGAAPLVTTVKINRRPIRRRR